MLYLALEDDYHRLQERLYRMFGTESTDNLYFSVSAGQLGNGLDEQLSKFMAEHSDTRLIIVDTLQKVHEVGGDNYSYANDYEIITRLKKFADNYGICLLLVHHTRKQNSDDKFDMISGTNGLLGAADGGFILRKKSAQAIRQRLKFQAEISRTKRFISIVIPKHLCGTLRELKRNCGSCRPNLCLKISLAKSQVKIPNGMAVRQSLLNFSVLI